MPHAEAQVGFGVPGHVPAKPVVRLAADLELLIGQLGTAKDVLLTRQTPTERQLDRLMAAGLTAPRCMAAALDHHVLPRRHPLRQLDGAMPQPWAWTPDTCHFFGPLRRSGATVPRWDAQSGRPWSKAWAALLLAELVSDAEFTNKGLKLAEIDVPVAVVSEVKLAARLKELSAAGVETAVIKNVLASSGRGAIRVACQRHTWTTSESRWLANTLRVRGHVVVAPWRERVLDLSVQLDLAAPTPVVGITGLLCDPLGRYLGNLVHEPDISVDHHTTLTTVAHRVAAALRSAGHTGLAGIDAMLFRDQTGELHLQPLLEVNPRTTMGHIALAIRRQLPDQTRAVLRLFGPRHIRRETVSAFTAASQANPTGDIVALTDPTCASDHIAMLFLGEAAVRRAVLL